MINNKHKQAHRYVRQLYHSKLPSGIRNIYTSACCLNLRKNENEGVNSEDKDGKLAFRSV